MTRLMLAIVFMSWAFNTKAQNVDTSFNYITEIQSFFEPLTDTIPKFPLSVNPINNLYLSRNYLERISFEDTIFQSSDFDFVLQQANQAKGMIWNKTLIGNADFVSGTSIDSAFKKKYGNYYYAMSFPYFSKDCKTCLIFTEYHCGGLCSSGEFQVYKKQNNKWVLYKTVETWIS